MNSEEPSVHCRRKSVFTVEHSPCHFKRPAYYLKQLRDCGDYRNCDIELVTNSGSERVHSAIVAAHCKRIAKLLELHNTPLRVDMRRFQPDLVLKMVEWMYNGKVEIVWEHMTEHMAVTNYLGDAFLHHQLENTLKSVANGAKTRIDAVNVATHPTTGVSPETVAKILDNVNESYEKFSMEEIMLFKPWAINSLVAAPGNAPKKASFLNIALDWLRSPQNISWLDIIVNNIYIENMNSRELIAFRRSLRAVLLNPSTRRLVTVSADDATAISINMDKPYRHPVDESSMGLEKKTGSSNPITQKENLFYPLLRHEQDRKDSSCDLSELPSYTNVTSEMCSTNAENSKNLSDKSKNRHAVQGPSVNNSSTKDTQKLPSVEKVTSKATSNETADQNSKSPQKVKSKVKEKAHSKKDLLVGPLLNGPTEPSQNQR